MRRMHCAARTLPMQGEVLMDSKPTYWGMSSSIDLYECELGFMQNAEAIKDFVRQLCERIQMRRYGETRA
jgi:hypothetical protein